MQQQEAFTLDKLTKNSPAIITKICATPFTDNNNLEQRLLAMGFVEGATVTIRHFNWLGGDPMVVEIDAGALIALRKMEASSICVQTLR